MLNENIEQKNKTSTNTVAIFIQSLRLPIMIGVCLYHNNLGVSLFTLQMMSYRT